MWQSHICHMPEFQASDLAMSTELDRLLSEAAETIRREAYSAGWRDAVAALSKAVTEAAELPPREKSANIVLKRGASNSIQRRHSG